MNRFELVRVSGEGLLTLCLLELVSQFTVSVPRSVIARFGNGLDRWECHQSAISAAESANDVSLNPCHVINHPSIPSISCPTAENVTEQTHGVNGAGWSLCDWNTLPCLAGNSTIKPSAVILLYLHVRALCSVNWNSMDATKCQGLTSTPIRTSCFWWLIEFTRKSCHIGLQPVFHLRFWEIFRHEKREIILHELSYNRQGAVSQWE